MATLPAQLHDATKAGRADATLVLLDQALDLVAKADDATARELRDRADAAVLLARRKRLDEVQRRAAELKLRAEARLGEIAPPVLTRAEVAKLGVEARRPDHEPPVRGPDHDAERVDLARCRKVAAVKEHIGAYLDYCKAAGEDPSRAGLFRYAADIERATKNAIAQQEASRQPAARVPLPSLDASPAAAVASSSAQMARTLAGAAAAAGKPQPKAPAKAPAPAELPLVGPAWRAIGQDLLGLAQRLGHARPARLAPAGARDIREACWVDLAERFTRFATSWVEDLNEAVELEPDFVEGYARERAKAARGRSA